MANRKGKFKVKNGSGSYDQVMLETQLGQVVDSPIKSLERKTRYELNDIAAEQTCKGAFLVCTTAGTTAASVPAEYTNAAEGAEVTDGTAVFKVHLFERISSVNDLENSESEIKKYVKTYVDSLLDSVVDPASLLNAILPKTSAAHNSVYRGKDLTEYWNSGEMSKAIRAGTFDDIFPGDYIIKSVTINGDAYDNVKWIVGDLDYHLNHNNDNKEDAHHVLLFPKTSLGREQMNTSDTTSGGYLGSKMWTTTIPLYATGIINAFGSDHVLTHRERLTKAVDTNINSAAGGDLGAGATVYASGEDVYLTVNIFNEAMVLGHAPWASSSRETYDCNKQVAAFRYGNDLERNSWFWLRDVVNATCFSEVYSGNVDYYWASINNGVLPYFLLY